MRYWERCWYCKKLVKGGIQGIRGHLRGCPFIRRVQPYQFRNKTIILDTTEKNLRFFDIIFNKLNLDDAQVLEDLLSQYVRSFGSITRIEYWIEDTPAPPHADPGNGG